MMMLDDYGNVLSSGKPVGRPDTDAPAGSNVPDFGGAAARKRSWTVIANSRNRTWASSWMAACARVASGGAAAEFWDAAHDEL